MIAEVSPAAKSPRPKKTGAARPRSGSRRSATAAAFAASAPCPRSGEAFDDDCRRDEAAEDHREHRVPAAFPNILVVAAGVGPAFQRGAGVEEQVVGNEGRADERQDSQQRTGGQAGDQDPGDQVADVRGGEPRDRAEHNAHQPDQTDQRVLDCLVGSGQQQPGGQPADDERQHLLR